MATIVAIVDYTSSSEGKELGTVQVGADGQALVLGEEARKALDTFVVVDLADPDRPKLELEDGQRYVDNLLKLMAGAYIRAEQIA